MKNRYKDSNQPAQPQRTFSLHLPRRVYEGWLLICIMGGLFLLLSLVSYHTSDPGWTSTGLFAVKPANWGGRVGAWLADLMLSLFGLIAYPVPVLIILSSCMKWKKESRPQSSIYEKILTLVGWVCLILSITALFDFYLNLPLPLPAGTGGIVGDVVGSGLALFFNRIGSTLVFLTLFLLGVTLVSGLSWLGLIQKMNQERGAFWRRLVALIKAPLLQFKEWRLVKQQEVKVAVKTTEPTFEPMPVAPRQFIEPTFSERVVTQDVQTVPISIAPIQQKPRISTADWSEDVLPPLALLNPPVPSNAQPFADISFADLSRLVEQRLRDFGVNATVVAVHPGPIITRFELDLAPGIKVSKITGLSRDIARSLSTVSVRIVDIIPGKSVIGLEMPNEHREKVVLRDILESARYVQSISPMTLVLGKDISGQAVVVDLAKMPHLLVAGTTGSGKSVSLNAMLLSMLYKATPAELRFIMIDPKMLELSIYDGIPHLLTPVITDMKHAANALRWCVAEMDKRYRLMASLGVRNLEGYNQKVPEAPLPVIVVVVDELADMMMVVGKKVEELIARIAQKARAAGIHLILATQRPSVDVITGLIKANIPTRIAFQVSSRIDSRTILDQQGAEQLLGHGDMLYLPPGAGVPTRVHGAYVADDEVHRVVQAWREKGSPVYIDDVTEETLDVAGGDDGEPHNEQDALYDDAVRIVTESQRASISLVQRRLRIGYNRAARMMEEMEARGVVSAMDGSGGREVLTKEGV